MITGTNEKPVVFLETRTTTFLLGRDIESYSMVDLYKIIANNEEKIRSLESIRNKPLSLIRDMKAIEGNIRQLVHYMDEREKQAHPEFASED